jgi:anti-sigma factor ChrR (cupin superfamily)
MLENVAGLQPLIDFALPDHAVDSSAIPWVPQAEGVSFKPLRFDLTNGRWINLLKVEAAGKLNRHRHGGPVIGYVLQGTWRYLERSWVASAGTLVYEPPGDVHTLIVEPGEEMITLFVLEGVVQYLDDEDRVIYQDDIFTKMDRYYAHCRENGIEPQDLKF